MREFRFNLAVRTPPGRLNLARGTAVEDGNVGHLQHGTRTCRRDLIVFVAAARRQWTGLARSILQARIAGPAVADSVRS